MVQNKSSTIHEFYQGATWGQIFPCLINFAIILVHLSYDAIYFCCSLFEQSTTKSKAFFTLQRVISRIFPLFSAILFQKLPKKRKKRTFN